MKRETVVRSGSVTKRANAVDAYVGARIRFRRNLLRLSQTQLGDRIGVTFQQVQKYEKGANRIGSSRLLRICDALEVTPAWLFQGAPMSNRKATATVQAMDTAFAAFLADGAAHRVIAVWPLLPAGIQRSLVELMVRIAGKTNTLK